MKIENLETAVELKNRLDVLRTLKRQLESYPTSTTFNVLSGCGSKQVVIQDDILTGVVYKYCEDKIKDIEDIINEL